MKSEKNKVVLDTQLFTHWEKAFLMETVFFSMISRYAILPFKMRALFHETELLVLEML